MPDKQFNDRVKGQCGALVLNQDGSIRTCDGPLYRRRVSEPFTSHTPMGSRIGTLFSYVVCEHCKRMYEE